MCQIVGTTLFKGDGSPYYTTPIVRGGLGAVFSIDVTNLTGAPTVTFTVQGRGPTATTWTDLGAFGAVTAAGIHTTDVSPLEANLRIKIEFDAGDAATDGLHFFVAAPAWRYYA